MRAARKAGMAHWAVGLIFFGGFVGFAEANQLRFKADEFATHFNRAASEKGLKITLALSGCQVHGKTTACAYPVSNVIYMTAMAFNAKEPARAVYLQFSGDEKDQNAVAELTNAAAVMAWTLTPNYPGAGKLMLDLLNEPGDKPTRRIDNIQYEVEIDSSGKVWFKATAK